MSSGDEKRLQVFLSCSGTGSGRSRAYASALHDFLVDISDQLQPWSSEKDIQFGSTWFESVGKALAGSRAVMVCLTKEACLSPWIIFEAGAAWNRGQSGEEFRRVVPLLFEPDSLDDSHPMSALQACTVGKAAFKQVLLQLIEFVYPDDRELERRVSKRFEKEWPAFAARIEAIRQELPDADSSKGLKSAVDPSTNFEKLLFRFESAISQLEGTFGGGSSPRRGTAKTGGRRKLSLASLAGLQDAASQAFSKGNFAAAREVFLDIKADNPGSLKPCVDAARALVRINDRKDQGDLGQAIAELRAGLKATRESEQDSARQACAHWNLACYEALRLGLSSASGDKTGLRARLKAIESDLRSAISLAPSYWDDLETEEDLEYIRSMLDFWLRLLQRLKPGDE